MTLINFVIFFLFLNNNSSNELNNNYLSTFDSLRNADSCTSYPGNTAQEFLQLAAQERASVEYYHTRDLWYSFLGTRCIHDASEVQLPTRNDEFRKNSRLFDC